MIKVMKNCNIQLAFISILPLRNSNSYMYKLRYVISGDMRDVINRRR